MKKWIRTLTGIVMSAFLTFGLGGKALAGDEEEALPEPPSSEIVESAPAPEPPKVAESAPAAEAPKPAETAPAAETPKPAEATPAAEVPKPAEAAPAVAEPAPVEQPVPVEAPAPAEEPVPVEVPAPVDETPKAAEPEPTAGAPKSSEAAHADEAPAPVEESGPVETPAAGEAPAPVEAPFPAEGSSPAEAPAPVGENASDEEAAPVKEPFMVEEPTLVEEASPVEEAAQIEEPAPAEDPPPVEESLPAEETAASEEPLAAAAVPSEENLVAAPVPVLSAAPMRALASSSTANGTGGESGDPAGAPDESASAGITVGGKDAAEEDGWTYDESSGQVGLINFNRADIDIVSSGLNGLNIAAAGFNRLRSISSEGDVRVTGTGLMLVDNVDLGENSGFYLQTPTDLYPDGTGSVALFIKSGENEYTLANGPDVVGLLDEQYALSGLDLVVPGECTLFLNSGGAVYEKDTHNVVFRFSGNEGEALAQQHGVTLGLEDESSSHGLDETYGALMVGSGASLTVEEGGTIRMASTKGLRLWSDHSKPLLSAENGGSLVIDGEVTGDGRIWLSEGSSLSGAGRAEAGKVTVDSAGALSDCAVTFRSDMLLLAGNGTIPSLVVEDSDVFLDYSDGDVTITDLVSSGSSSLIINEGGNLTLGSITNSGTVTVYSDTEYPGADSICDLTGVVKGGTLRLSGGVFHLKDGFSAEDGAALAYDHVIVYDHVGSSASFGAPLVVSPGQVAMPTPGNVRCSVPLVVTFATGDMVTGEFRTTEINKTEFSKAIYIKNSAGKYVLDLRDPNSYPGGVNLLKQLLSRDDISGSERALFIIEFQNMDEAGNLSFRSRTYFDDEMKALLDGTDSESASALSFELGDTYLVRITLTNNFPILPAGVVTPPSTSFTGTGTLGGAGSLGSGSATMLFRGSAYSHHDPQPDPSDTEDPPVPDPLVPDPQPMPPDPTPPGPEPDASLPGTAVNDRRVIVSPNGRYYTVRVYIGIREIAEPGQKISARMKFTLPAGWSKNAVYAVFRNADGSLTAFKAAYDEESGTLSFDTDLTGSFALISFPFDGKLYSEEFYKAISELEDIRLLPVRR